MAPDDVGENRNGGGGVHHGVVAEQFLARKRGDDL